MDIALKNKRYQEKLTNLFGDRYTLVGDYQDSNSTVIIRCNNCHKNQKRQAKYFLTSGSCRYCSGYLTSSRGEELIKHTLIASGYTEFVTQYRVKSLDDKHNLTFDFYYPSKDIFIEYQGIQHYNMDSFFMTDDYHARDLDKKEYVKEHNSILLEPNEYSFKNISEVLSPYFPNLVAPKVENYRDSLLPIYQIYKDSRTMPNKDVCTKYGIGSTKLDKLVKLYKDTEYELPQVKSETKYAPVKMQDQKSFEDELKRVSNNRYDVLGSYKDSNTPILIRCHKCNQEFTVRPRNIIRPKNLESMGCRYCEGSYAKTKEQTQKLLDYMYPNQYVLPDDYAGVAKKVMIYCNKCGKESDKKPTQVLSGNGCRCSSKRFGDDTNSSPKVSLEVANKLLLGIK